jgi:hypothetical protein
MNNNQNLQTQSPWNSVRLTYGAASKLDPLRGWVEQQLRPDRGFRLSGCASLLANWGMRWQDDL